MTPPKQPQEITLRDYFAAAIAQGLVAHPHSRDLADEGVADHIACEAFAGADAMLREREK